MTRRLRGIHAAWHFGCAVNFGGESGLRKLGLGGTHPLTQRYVLITKSQLVASFLCFLGFLILVLSANWLSVVAVFWTPIRGREKFRELPH
ncbi:DUF3265 domain-containing protein [Vibrio vulnificus]